MTPKQTRFVQEYLIDLNATQAAIRAGYSEKTAAEMGYENLNKPQIAEAVKEALDKRAAKTEVDQEFVVNGLRDIAIQGESESARVRSLELLGKHVGMFVDRSKLEVTGGLDLEFTDAAERFTALAASAVRQAARKAEGDAPSDT